MPARLVESSARSTLLAKTVVEFLETTDDESFALAAELIASTRLTVTRSKDRILAPARQVAVDPCTCLRSTSGIPKHPMYGASPRASASILSLTAPMVICSLPSLRRERDLTPRELPRTTTRLPNRDLWSNSGPLDELG
jgi:hypothetical protein